MKKLHFISCAILMTLTTSVFAGTQVKYETHYTIEKSTQVEHLKISQTDLDSKKIENV